jgi:ATP-dependent DNA helicase PIF1
MSDYAKVKELIDKRRNIFLTGSAGTGKSYMLNEIKRDYPGIQLTASTGIAAVNINGTTIHSFAGIGIGDRPVRDIYENMFNGISSRIKYVKMLAIDEISMLSGRVLNLIDEVFRYVRCNDEPFGGIQMIVVGDFLQLPPVTESGRKDFAFKSSAWRDAKFENIVLDKVYRQDDTDFVDVLDKIRFGKDLNEINFTHGKEFEGKVLNLFALNQHANIVNKKRLATLPSELVTYKAIDEGTSSALRTIDNNCLAIKNLQLKVGARVILLINKYIEKGLINGSSGIVRELSPNYVQVEFDNGEVQDLGFESVSKIVVGKKTMAERTQIPLRLAWALSIHKAQGMTLDRVHIDMRGIFEEGQAYVALSRVRSRAGLSVVNLDNKTIRANKDAVEFMQSIA